MADDLVLNPGVGGATVAADQVGAVYYPRSKLTLGADGVTDGDVSTANPLPVRDYQAKSPQVTYATSASVAPGSSADLDSAQVTSGKTGKLLGLLVSSSVPFKWDLKTVSNGVASSTVRAVGFSSDRVADFRPPGRDFFSVAQDATAGLDGFRVTVTNLNTGSGAADVYATFFYDEV